MRRPLAAIWREDGFLYGCGAIVAAALAAGIFGVCTHDVGLAGLLLVPVAAAVIFGLA